jgi:dTDP-4-dehydrorhamnose 3,5-epimerase-like enzyme
MSLIKWAPFETIGDGRGQLVALESNNNIPFEIKRVYYMTKMKPTVPRGFHAHRQLKQVAICVAGHCRFILDDGIHREEVWLDSPGKGLIIGNMVWREMHDFSQDCVLMVLASEYYDEADYIRSYNEFKEMASHG